MKNASEPKWCENHTVCEDGSYILHRTDDDIIDLTKDNLVEIYGCPGLPVIDGQDIFGFDPECRWFGPITLNYFLFTCEGKIDKLFEKAKDAFPEG